GESALDSPPDDDPIDDDFNRVIAPTVQFDVVFESAELAVDPRFREAPSPQRGDLFLEFALAASNNRRQDVDPFFLGVEHHHIDDSLERLRGDCLSATWAMRNADVGEQQP